MEDLPKNHTRNINVVTLDGGIPTITIDPPTISGPLVEDDVDFNEIPPELPIRPTKYTPKLEHNSPEHKESAHINPTNEDRTHTYSAHTDLVYADSKHKPKIKIEPAHATKSKNSPPVRAPLALAVDFSDDKIPALPARRRLSQPTIMPFGKQATEPYVNTSDGRVTVRPFTWKSAEPIGNDVKDDDNANEPVGTDECVMSEANGDVRSVSEGNTHEGNIFSSENDDILDISPVTASFLITHNLNKDQNTRSDNIKRIKDLTIDEIGDILRLLKLDEYAAIFKTNHVDGAILTSLERDDLVNELGMKTLHATRLFMYMSEGHITK